MKVHPCAHGLWDHHQSHETRTLLLGCKRLHSLAPKLVTTRDYIKHFKSEVFDLKSFIRSEKIDHAKKQSTIQVETQAGGTRWNPMQEQIGILELLYQGGMRTPNAQQIEQITQQLSKYGKIEGKNVFYWFQNHKARERQKKKRSILGLNHLTRTPPLTSPVDTFIALTLDAMVDVESHNQSAYKRKCMSWTFESFEENNMKCNYIDDKDKTLELFPLHPEGR